MVVDLYLRSSTHIPVPYTVTIANPVYTGIEHSWNWGSPQCSSGQITGEASEAWQALGPGQLAQEVNIGCCVLGSSTDLYPVSVTVAGRRCTLLHLLDDYSGVILVE